MKFRVIKVDNRYEDVSIEKEVLSEIGADLEEYNLRNEEQIIEIVKDADGIITDLSPITKKVIENLRKCKVISKVGIGVDNIDVDIATKKGIFVCNVPDYCIQEVSDHALALILCCARKINLMDSLVKRGTWSIDKAKPIHPLNGLTLGLVGFGSISRLVYLKTKVFGLNVILYDPYSNNEVENEYDIKLVEFDYLLKNSDIISIHCPANPQTYHLFSHAQFERMEPNSYLVNTARGIIVDSKALYLALKNKIIAGAAVDVYDPEPIDPSDPILKLDNFIITPHYGFYSERSIKEVRLKSALNVAKVLMNEEPINLVNREVLSK